MYGAGSKVLKKGSEYYFKFEYLEKYYQVSIYFSL